MLVKSNTVDITVIATNNTLLVLLAKGNMIDIATVAYVYCVIYFLGKKDRCSDSLLVGIKYNSSFG